MRQPKRQGKGGNPSDKASVGARFTDVPSACAFLERLGMPGSLVKQLSGWLEDLSPGQVEQMEPELSWEWKEARLVMRAMLDEEDDEVDVEFVGPATLIEALQADLDDFFGPKKRQ